MTDANVKLLSRNEWDFDWERPFLIAGPCSAESEEQVLNTAAALKNYPLQLFRAGIWKPRTRPGEFEGVGEKGLAWLRQAKKEYGSRCCIEVAKAAHVEAALKHDIDAFWIGARTTVNPFMVQEIADSLKGVDIPVLIKNPVNPDLGLWIGAIERVHRAGINKIIAIHRGFSARSDTKYRNEPIWEIPIELNRRLPQLPLLCDPSHICGNTQDLLRVSQKAIDLNYSGLMLEVHIDPPNALSDPKQQLLPDEFGSLIARLTIRATNSDDPLFQSSLEALRDEIDQLDADMIRILVERMGIVDQMGNFKKENDITILQPERWDEIIETRSAHGKSRGLSKEFLKQLLDAIHQESIRRQTRVMNDKAEENA